MITLSVSEKKSGPKCSKKVWITKNLYRMQLLQKNNLKNAEKMHSFFDATILQAFPDPDFFPMKSSKTETAAKSAEKYPMLRVTNLCLACFG